MHSELLASRAALALTLATINQVFSLLDPLIFRHVIDQYATRFSEYTTAEFFSGVSLLLGGGRGRGVRVASREELPGLLHQRHHAAARRAALLDGIRHSLELPYSVFEDQRSGETLGKLQKVRTDVEKLIADRHQRAVHVARRDHLRDDLRVQRPLGDRAGVLPDRARSSACSAPC